MSTPSELDIQSAADARSQLPAERLAEALQGHWLGDAPSQPITPATAGYFNPTHPRQLSLLGTAARQWLEQSSAEALNRAITAVQIWILPKDGPALPAPLAGKGCVLRSGLDESNSLRELRYVLSEGCAKRLTVHGVLVDVLGLGVLLTGHAGVGKSELALELLGRGHQLIADDAVDLFQLPHGMLIGRCPPLLQDFLEVRGLGILDAARMYGGKSVLPRQRVDLIIRLRRAADARPSFIERLEGLRSTRDIMGIPIPEISLPVAVGHNLATLVEAACRDHWVRIDGYRADAEFAQRQQHAIQNRQQDS